jgi:hypothetical protein
VQVLLDPTMVGSCAWILTSEICPPLQRSSCLHSDLTTLVLSGILNGIQRSGMLLKLYGPSIIRSMLHCLRSVDLPELIFCLPVGYKLPVLMPSSLLYFPSMTSIRCLLSIFHSLSVKYFPTISPFGIDGNTSTHMHSDSTPLLPNSFLPL